MDTHREADHLDHGHVVRHLQPVLVILNILRYGIRSKVSLGLAPCVVPAAPATTQTHTEQRRDHIKQRPTHPLSCTCLKASARILGLITCRPEKNQMRQVEYYSSRLCLCFWALPKYFQKRTCGVWISHSRARLMVRSTNSPSSLSCSHRRFDGVIILDDSAEKR